MMRINRYIILIIITILATVHNAQAQQEEYIEVIDEQGKCEEIGVPPLLMFNVDSMLALYHAKTLIHEKGDCNLIDIDVYADRETIIERMKRMPTVIEMPYNESVRKFIDRYTQRARRQVSLMLGIANFYMPIFEQALEIYGIPLELKYLPIIESGLNPNAVSRVGATGLWQFMIGTGKQYDLQVNSLIDERRDPIKSSYAAAHYLSDLYKIFGDWNLAIAAYNCGPERINKAIHRAGGETDYWKIYPYLPKETRGYVPSFIAANYIMNYYCEHNICPMETNLPLKSDTIIVDKDIHFEQIAAVIGIDIRQLKELNPQYRRNIVNGNNGTATIRMPMPYITKFIDNQDSILNYNTGHLPTKRSEVAIAESSKDSPTTYAHRPQMSEPDAPATSSKLSTKSSQSQISNRGWHLNTNHKRQSTGRIQSKISSKNKTSTKSSVKVEKGQTLTEIAKKHHTTVDKLKKLNKLSGNNIRAGKQLKVK
ncbi:MAG: transglycosylase SLT domain-containing protein [Prevotella sp.]|nr:transglycosylase SLT domain-containing protein [Prevotella sp.]